MIRHELNKVIGTGYSSKWEVLKVIQIKNICAVFLNPPYRECPNVFLFKYSDGEYHRVLEGLAIGIIDSSSGIEDLHTKGTAVDFQIDNVKTNYFNSPVIKSLINGGVAKNSPITIYQQFIHVHTVPGVKDRYVIDKTYFYNIALKMFGKDHWQDYPTAECVMYDIPKLIKLNFEFIENRYIVSGETNNNQYWKISFSDVDGSNEYLLNKKIAVQ